MGWIRKFTTPEGHGPRVRDIDSDAPTAMRQELVDLFFSLVDNNPHVLRVLDHEHIYRVSSQSMGQPTTANPFGGYRNRVGRDIQNAQWQQVYDLICRVWPDFSRADLGDLYREGVNRILSAHGIAWDLDENGQLRRVLPEAVRAMVTAAIAELSTPQFKPALDLFNAGRDAYDARPRRDRDACTNAFDAMEAVAKIIYEMPAATFGDVIKQIRKSQSLDDYIVRILESINVLRHNKFGHGMTEPFNLSSAEVDFTYLTCIGGILLLVRMTRIGAA